MFHWKFFDVNGEHLGNSESFKTIAVAAAWLQLQAENDLPDVDVDADNALLAMTAKVRIERKVRLSGMDSLLAAAGETIAVTAQPETAPTAAPAPRRGRKLAVVPTPADIADQVPQSEPEPAVAELAGVMAGDAELTPRTPAEAEALIVDIQAKLDAAPHVTSTAIIDCVKDHLLQSGAPASEAQLIARIDAKLKAGASGIDVSAILDALAEDGALLAAGIEWYSTGKTIVYSLKQPESAPEPTPAPTAPQEPWEVVCNGVVVELRVGDTWSHLVYQQPTAASTVADRLRGHMASGATGPASVAQRFLPGRAPAAPEL